MTAMLPESATFDAVSRAYHVAVLAHDGAGALLEQYSAHPESDAFLLTISNCGERLLSSLCEVRLFSGIHRRYEA